MAFAAVSAGLLFFTVALIFAIDADPAVRRRPHLGIRVLVVVVIPFSLLVLFFVGVQLKLLPIAGTRRLAWILVVLSVAFMFVPAVLFRRSGSSSGPPDANNGGGGPGQPPAPPRVPHGGIPLLSADQPLRRVRDHTAPKLGSRPRRPTRDREPTTTLTLPHG
jgi:uncharacterized membrane protein